MRGKRYGMVLNRIQTQLYVMAVVVKVKGRYYLAQCVKRENV